MKIREAFEFLAKNYQSLSKKQESIIGVAYLPQAPDGEFEIYTLGLDEEEFEEGSLYFTVYFQAGIIGSSSGVDDYFSGESIEEIVNEIPSIGRINFNIYSLDPMPFGLMTEYSLKAIFPELPDPDKGDVFNAKIFRKEAIELIEQLNKPPLYH